MSKPPTRSARPTSARERRPRWYLLYFVLAGFDLLTIGVSLSLNRRLIDVHTRSVRVNQEWSDRRGKLSELGQSAAAVNAPGNDVFDSHDVPAERQRMREALALFKAAAQVRRRDLTENVKDRNGARLVEDLDQVEAAMQTMVEEAELIFKFFEEGRSANAGERMATMDRKFAQLNNRLTKVRTTIQEIQNEAFSQQNQVIASLRRYEYVITSAIVLMVCGIAYYGHKLSQSMARAIRENEKHLSAIQASERRYRLLFENTPMPAWVCDRQSLAILNVNEAAIRHYGYTHDEFLQFSLEQIQPLYFGRLPSLPAGDGPTPAPQIIRHRKKDGSLIDVEMSAYAFDFEGKAALLVLANDITERKQSELALIESEARAQRAHAEAEALLSTISAVFIGIDTSGIIARWNSTAEAVFGIATSKALGQHVVDCGIRWNWKAVENAIVESVGTKRSIELNEISFTRPDGKDGYLHVVVTPAKNDDNDGLAFTLLARDVTDHRALESQLRQSQKLESIGQLAAGVAHEINTPIQFVGDNLRFLQESFASLDTVVSLIPDLLEQQKAHNTDLASAARTTIDSADLGYLKEEIPKAITQSLEGTARVANIVQAMKNFSHPDAVGMQPTQLNAAIDATITVARCEWKYVAELVTEFDSNLPLVSCLPGEINQVILNLVVNAAHAIADTPLVKAGGKGQITVATRHEPDWVEIRVTDTGTGIPEHARAKLFDPFFTTKAVGKGTGQGLFIAHNVVVEKHGGTITFETELGKGTTFVVRLPVHPMGDRKQRNAA